MSARAPTPHDFLLHLRGRTPALARRLDGITGLERSGHELRVRSPTGGWALRELERLRGELSGEAHRFFGPETAVVLVPGPENPEALPFPVLASKLWNHVVFWVWHGGRSGALAVRKTHYAEAWMAAARRGGEEGLVPLADPEAVWLGEELPPETALPHLLDRLADLARAHASYAQLVAPFPGDGPADRLEARLYAVKEWGTPRTPAPILQKYTGRLHYADPARPPLGVRLARGLLSGAVQGSPLPG
ncbi:MAG: hypothetical protein SCH98_17720 [Deferrisomatales bacterium]|nr:hypothetical protein [Deferrisomatales bacterium]